MGLCFCFLLDSREHTYALAPRRHLAHPRSLGSGTFSVEAAVATVVPHEGHVLVLDNGAYCKRAAKRHGFILYPGKLTQTETLRVGCIGAIGTAEMEQAVDAVALAMQELGIAHGVPAGV